MAVIFTPKALRQLNQLCHYLDTEWSPKVCDRKLDDCLAIIGRTPFAYPASERKPAYRKCVVTHQTIVFYQVKRDAVFILMVKDSRQKRIF